MIYSRIVGTGSYLPEKILTNQDLEKLVDTSDEWIVERTGIKKRHVAGEAETASTMGTLAARAAIAAANIEPAALDMIIVATATPDRFFPSTACLIQNALGINNIPAFDVSAACAGFIYAMSIADQFIRSATHKNILIIGSEVLSRAIDWSDRRTCILFGDGAGAVILQASAKPGIHTTHLHADGKYKDLLYLPNDSHAPSLKGDTPYVHMQGHDVFKLAVKAMGDSVAEELKENQLDQHEIDWLVPHQANLRIIKAIAKKLDLPMERVILTVDEQGNTSSASIPLALDYGIRSAKIKPGDKMLLEGFGGGMAWGSALVTL